MTAQIMDRTRYRELPCMPGTGSECCAHGGGGRTVRSGRRRVCHAGNPVGRNRLGGPRHPPDLRVTRVGWRHVFPVADCKRGGADLVRVRCFARRGRTGAIKLRRGIAGLVSDGVFVGFANPLVRYSFCLSFPRSYRRVPTARVPCSSFPPQSWHRQPRVWCPISSRAACCGVPVTPLFCNGYRAGR